MSSEKRRPVAILITHGLELLDAQGDPVGPSGTVRRSEVEALLSGDILAVGAVAPHLAAEVGLKTSVDITLALGANQDALIENGRLILAATRAATSAGDRGRIRMLRSWFPCVLRMREVHEFLDGLGPAQAEQIVGLRSGPGRTPRPAEQAGLVLTMDMLRATGLSAAAAAERIAKVPNAGVRADRLRNLHSDLGPLVRCLGEGYAIAASEVPCLPWGQRPDDEWSVYVKGF
jgi:hypothetical protein